MLFEKPGSSEKIILKPQRTFSKDGMTVHEEGYYVWFQGNPPTFDSVKEAERIAAWERQMGKMDRFAEKEFNKRVKFLDAEIIKFIETLPEYEPDPYKPQQIGKIQKAISQRERLIIDGHAVCEYCKEEIKAFENVLQLQDHIKDTHADLLMAELQKKLDDKGTIKDENPAEAGQV